MGKFVIKTSDAGCRFNLVAGNGQVIGTSQTYKSMDACKNGIESVKTNAAVAGIEDQTKEGFTELKNPKFEIYKACLLSNNYLPCKLVQILPLQAYYPD